MCCTRLAANAGPKKVAKNRLMGTITNFVGLYLRNEGTYRQSEKNLLSSNISPTSSQYGELRPTSGWNRFVSLGHPSKFQPVSRLGSVTAWQSSSERQPNFAALNRGRHLCSAGRPSRWALAHILVFLSWPSDEVLVWLSVWSVVQLMPLPPHHFLLH